MRCTCLNLNEVGSDETSIDPLCPVHGLMCENCRDAVTRDGDELVGSDGEVNCPESDRPHGPAVPDTAWEDAGGRDGAGLARTEHDEDPDGTCSDLCVDTHPDHAETRGDQAR